MTLTEMAEYALPTRPAGERIFELLGVVCAMCAGKTIAACPDCDDDIVCTACHQRICVMCGCTDLRACPDGCSWILPGVCSTHDGDVRMAKRAVPETPIAALQFTN